MQSPRSSAILLFSFVRRLIPLSRISPVLVFVLDLSNLSFPTDINIQNIISKIAPPVCLISNISFIVFNAGVNFSIYIDISVVFISEMVTSP